MATHRQALEWMQGPKEGEHLQGKHEYRIAFHDQYGWHVDRVVSESDPPVSAEQQQKWYLAINYRNEPLPDQIIPMKRFDEVPKPGDWS